MRANWRNRLLVLGSLGPALAGAGDALANGHFRRGAYAEPTAYVVETVPTAYVLPSAYIVPSTYVVPTTYVPYSPAYVPATYVLSPSYSYVAPTSYRRYVATGFGLPRTYVATSALFPTVVETQAVSGSCDPCAVAPPCCDSAAAAPSISVPARQETNRSSVPPAEAATGPRFTPSTVESAAEPAPAAATLAEPTVRRETSPAPPRPAARGAVDPNFSTPPDSPAHEKDVATTPTPATIQSTPITPPPAAEKPQPKAEPKLQPQPQPAATPPVAPGAEGSPLDLPGLAGEAGAVRHEVQKPAGPSAYLRSVRKGDLHKLEGRVISTETGRPEEGVRVTISDRANTISDRVAISNAFGRYAFDLPDGEWTVNVTMPSGRSYPVSQLRVANGQINDDLGRDIPSLTINR